MQTVTVTFAVISLFICFAIRPCLAEKIHIATGEFPPLYTEKTKTNGPVLQIVKEAFSVVGIDVKFEFVPWARANHYTLTGQVDASCCWFEQQKRASFGYYSKPVFAYSYSFFHLKSTDFDWNTIADLRGIALGGTLSYTYTAEFTQAEKDKVIYVERVGNDLLNLKKLLYGRISAFPLNTDVGHQLIAENFSAQERQLFTYHPKPLFKNNVHLVFPKILGKSAAYLELFNAGLAAIHERGRYQEILQEYEQEKQNYLD